MERSSNRSFALVLTALVACAVPGLAHAGGTATGVEQFMTPSTETASPLGEDALAQGPARESDASLVSLRYREKAHTDHPAIRIGGEPTRLESARYRPRRGSSRTSSSYGGSTQIHGGFFDPDGDPDRGILFGFRLGPKVDEHVQVGVGMDWRHRSQSYTELIGTGIGPGGEEIEIRRELSRSTSDWVPVQLFAELNAGNDMTVVPYFGLSGGYQWLGISGDNYNDGSIFETTFGGWGWQGWGGVAFPIGPRSRVNAEVFVNGAELHRDSIDELTGDDVRETVSMDGVGARLGLSWGFF
jgi:hypothetical protein